MSRKNSDSKKDSPLHSFAKTAARAAVLAAGVDAQYRSFSIEGGVVRADSEFNWPGGWPASPTPVTGIGSPVDGSFSATYDERNGLSTVWSSIDGDDEEYDINASKVVDLTANGTVSAGEVIMMGSNMSLAASGFDRTSQIDRMLASPGSFFARISDSSIVADGPNYGAQFIIGPNVHIDAGIPEGKGYPVLLRIAQDQQRGSGNSVVNSSGRVFYDMDGPGNTAAIDTDGQKCLVVSKPGGVTVDRVHNEFNADGTVSVTMTGAGGPLSIRAMYDGIDSNYPIRNLVPSYNMPMYDVHGNKVLGTKADTYSDNAAFYVYEIPSQGNLVVFEGRTTEIALRPFDVHVVYEDFSRLRGIQFMQGRSPGHNDTQYDSQDYDFLSTTTSSVTGYDASGQEFTRIYPSQSRASLVNWVWRISGGLTVPGTGLSVTNQYRSFENGNNYYEYTDQYGTLTYVENGDQGLRAVAELPGDAYHVESYDASRDVDNFSTWRVDSISNTSIVTSPGFAKFAELSPQDGKINVPEDVNYAVVTLGDNPGDVKITPSSRGNSVTGYRGSAIDSYLDVPPGSRLVMIRSDDLDDLLIGVPDGIYPVDENDEIDIFGTRYNITRSEVTDHFFPAVQSQDGLVRGLTGAPFLELLQVAEESIARAPALTTTAPEHHSTTPNPAPEDHRDPGLSAGEWAAIFLSIATVATAAGIAAHQYVRRRGYDAIEGGGRGNWGNPVFDPLLDDEILDPERQSFLTGGVGADYVVEINNDNDFTPGLNPNSPEGGSLGSSNREQAL